MIMSQKVVVLQTSIDVSWSALKWLVHSLFLNPGDELIFVAVLRQILPGPLSWNGYKRLLRSTREDDCDKVYGSNRRAVEEELIRIREKFQQNVGTMQMQNMYEVEKVKVKVEVEAGTSRKLAAIRAVKKLGATWVILDRAMKKDKQYFMDRLSCGISSIKRNNIIAELRGPDEHMKYDDMIPSYSWEDLPPSQRKSPIAQEASSHRVAHRHASVRHSAESYQVVQHSSIIQPRHSPIQETENANRRSVSARIPPEKGQNKAQNAKHNPHEKNAKRINEEEEFEHLTCPGCKNKRPRISMHRDFSYDDLYKATNGFSRDNFISEGGFGFVYRGELDGLQIAVKQHKAASLQGEKEFKSEVHVLSQARHWNLVMLLGSCSEGNQRLLVYEYVCNGSLEEHLSGDLNWEQRIKIALGAAKGLEYLHARNIVHRDMRPSNILITHDHEARLGDFGLAKAQQEGAVHSSDSGVVGTLGYMAPEYAESGKLSTKTDVYAFGVVMLQLITGLSTTDEMPEGKSLVEWAKPLLRTKNYPKLIDKRIGDLHDVHKLLWMVRVAEDCLKKDPNERCTMEQVILSLSRTEEGSATNTRDFAMQFESGNHIIEGCESKKRPK